jgi:uncharacterized protein YdeI (BOF family)
MSIRHLHFRDLLFSVLLLSLSALFASSGQAEGPRVGFSWGVDRIHSDAEEGQVVTLEGHVVSISRKRFFTLEDASGERIVTVIPENLQRETGTPAKGETIRVRGKYDHKTFLDGDKSTKADTRKNWGIRVSAVHRNVSTSGRNPNPPDWGTLDAGSGSTGAPAAPLTAVTVGTPNTPGELKARLSAARTQTRAAQKELGDARQSHARAVHQKVGGDEMAALVASEQRAQQKFDEAAAAMRSLVEEARKSGASPKLIELYEAGITGPAR